MPYDYNSALKEAQRVIRKIDGYQDVIGDLALELQTTYGESTLKRFSKDLEIPYSTIRDYKIVAQAFENVDRSTFWTIRYVLAGREDRHKWLQESNKHKWSKRELKKQLKEHDFQRVKVTLEETEIDQQSLDVAVSMIKGRLDTQKEKAKKIPSVSENIVGELKSIDYWLDKIKARIKDANNDEVKRALDDVLDKLYQIREMLNEYRAAVS